MGGLTRPRVARDIILDSGALSRLAAGDNYAKTFLQEIARIYDPPMYLVPHVVMTEVTTGYRRDDVRMDIFLKSIDDPDEPGAFWLPTSPEIARRAGVLRTEAHASRDPQKRPVSAVDAQVVAHAEERSQRRGVTILTSDPGDLSDLLDGIVPHPRNIAVESI